MDNAMLVTVVLATDRSNRIVAPLSPDAVGRTVWNITYHGSGGVFHAVIQHPKRPEFVMSRLDKAPANEVAEKAAWQSVQGVRAAYSCLPLMVTVTRYQFDEAGNQIGEGEQLYKHDYTEAAPGKPAS